MAKRCEICGKEPQYGHHVSHAKNRVNRRFEPNLQMGRVMVATISFAGMMPLFTMTTTRGKSVLGNTDDGVFRAQKTPARHSTTAMNVMEIAWCVAKRPSPEEGAAFIAPGLKRNWWPTFRPLTDSPL